MVSVDTKKKELIGNLSRDGKIVTTETIEVFDHDFPSLAEGVAIPHTVYDTVQNKVYETKRKVVAGFKESMRILFDNILGQWNYVVTPKNEHLEVAEITGM